MFLRFNDNNGKAKLFKQDLKFPNGELRWLTHKNKGVDLALMNINPRALQDNFVEFSIFNEEMFAKHKNFQSIGIEVGDEVYVLGFPMGIAGEIQNYPYVKLGIISRFDRELIKKSKAYLIDSSIFPGNSGSPVVLKPEVASLQGTTAISQIYLMGVISSYLPYEEKLYTHQTNPPSIVSLERENSGLSFVIPMEFVKEIFSRWKKQKKKLEKAGIKFKESEGDIKK